MKAFSFLASSFLASLVGLILLSTQAFALNFDGNVSAELQKQMTEDLSFMKTIQGTSQTKLHQEIFGAVDGKSYGSFFETRIQAVGLDGCGNQGAVACVKPFENPNKMWMTENFTKFSHPQIARLMIIYHEARHSERRAQFWHHDRCPTPFLDDNGKDKSSIWTGNKLAGMPACDSTAYGSYGSSTIMLKNIGKFCTNCSDKVKMDADMYSMDQLGRIDRDDVKQAMLNDFNGK